MSFSTDSAIITYSYGCVIWFDGAIMANRHYELIWCQLSFIWYCWQLTRRHSQSRKRKYCVRTLWVKFSYSSIVCSFWEIGQSLFVRMSAFGQVMMPSCFWCLGPQGLNQFQAEWRWSNNQSAFGSKNHTEHSKYYCIFFRIITSPDFIFNVLSRHMKTCSS